MILSNNIAPGINAAKADFITGKQLVLYREHLEGGKIVPEFIDVPEIEDFFEENDALEYLQRTTTDFIYLGNTFTEFIRARSRDMIAKFGHIDATTARAATMKGGIIPAYYFNDWTNYSFGHAREVPAFAKERPFRYPESRKS